jgi:predicted nucleic acid-binding Zn finger protein
VNLKRIIKSNEFYKDICNFLVESLKKSKFQVIVYFGFNKDGLKRY